MITIFEKTLTGAGMWSAVVSRGKRLRLTVSGQIGGRAPFFPEITSCVSEFGCVGDAVVHEHFGDIAREAVSRRCIRPKDKSGKR